MSLNNLPSENKIGRTQIDQVGMIGLGVIGASWTALMLAKGINVIGYDPSSNVKEKVEAEIQSQKANLTALGLATEKWGQLTIEKSIEAVVQQVDMVQENGPERLEAKQELLKKISIAASPDVVIASSTSGLMPSELAVNMHNPERFIVAHPFLPVTIMPLVEIVGGEKTLPATLKWASAFYEELGKKPVILKKEIPGLLANRFQVVLLEEALSLVESGVASVEEIEAAFVNGPGIRWALYGPISLFALAAGDSGFDTAWKRFSEHRLRVLESVHNIDDENSVLAHINQHFSELKDVQDTQVTQRERDNHLVKLIALKQSDKLFSNQVETG